MHSPALRLIQVQVAPRIPIRTRITLDSAGIVTAVTARQATGARATDLDPIAIGTIVAQI